MKILVLEDEDRKYSMIKEQIETVISVHEIHRVSNWLEYSQKINQTKFDLILLDLFVPKSHKDKTIENHCDNFVDTTRDYNSMSFRPPAIVLTQQSLDAGDFVYDLNLVDINVINFNDEDKWKEALKIKLLASQPERNFEFIIICALEKEANAFQTETDSWEPLRTISGLLCREIQIGDLKGVIVLANRMGLVSAAVVTSMAIERFKPRLVCMSGICGGVKGESEIYDLLVTQTCHQHDAGKWTSSGFKTEHYDLQLEVATHNKLIEICRSEGLSTLLIENLNPIRSEIPNNKNEIVCRINSNAVTSSGSAVIAEEGKISDLIKGQRKLAGFDMEIFSVYEAARYAIKKPIFFAAKAVVDDGDQNKGDTFHRIGCLISARFVANTIREGIINIS